MFSQKAASLEAELLQGTLGMLILKVVALQPTYGYVIVQRLQRISKGALQIKQGSLYPALYRLEKKGWLEPEWTKTEGGRRARVYRLTRDGRKQLDLKAERWGRLSSAIALVLEASGDELE